MADSSVKFDKNGDGIARYTIYNYQKRLSDGATDYKTESLLSSILIRESDFSFN